MIRHLAQQRADVNYRITVAWYVFLLKGNQAGNGMVWIFALKISIQITYTCMYLYHYIPDISGRTLKLKTMIPELSQFFWKMEPLRVLPLGLIHAQDCADLPLKVLIPEGSWGLQ